VELGGFVPSWFKTHEEAKDLYGIAVSIFRKPG